MGEDKQFQLNNNEYQLIYKLIGAYRDEERRERKKEHCSGCSFKYSSAERPNFSISYLSRHK